MKYGSLKNSASKVFNIPLASGGVNTVNPPQNIKDNQLALGLNIWNKNSALETRPGIYTEINNVLQTDILNGADEKSFHITNTVYYYNGEYRRIAYSIGLYDISNAFIFVFLIGSNRSVTSIGSIYFGRVTDDVFFLPESATFYVGKGQQGSGIYAFVSLRNFNDNSQTEYRIFEANSALDAWSSTISYYIPTVLINGRGNLYETAKSNDAAFTGSPLKLEAPNLLNGSFYAYYTSDGYSSNFRLPFSSISASSVICRVYYSRDSYVEWQISGSETSATQNLAGKEVTVSVDREKGVVYFDSQGLDYAVERYSIYSENNIRILAKKEISEGFNEVVSCKSTAVCGSRIVFSVGNRGNKIYYTKFENPLYFPQNLDNEIGSPDNSITALCSVKDKIIAFKADEIYTAVLKHGDAISSTSLLADKDILFYKTDEFDIKCISKTCGSISPYSIALCKDTPVWLGTDGRIYSYNNRVYRLSDNIEALSDDEILSALAAADGKHYFLCYGSKAIIMEYTQSGLSGNTENISFYFWEFPEEISSVGVFNYNGIVFIFENLEAKVCFAASLYGNEDIIISNALGENITLPYEIESVVKTKSFYLDSFSRKKKIDSICLLFAANGETEVILSGGEEIFGEFHFEESDFSSKLGCYKRLMPDFAGINMFDITVKSTKGISFSSADVYYSDL